MDAKKVRRLNGVKDPQPRQGKDGEWREYVSLLPEQPTIGSSLFIFWDIKTTPLLPGSDGGAPATITSAIATINPD
jgi:hypothetical protein